MNTLVYADVPQDKASNASSIASTLQQLSASFGVAAAGLTTIFFIPSSSHSTSGRNDCGAARGLFGTRHFHDFVDRRFYQAEER